MLDQTFLTLVPTDSLPSLKRLWALEVNPLTASLPPPPLCHHSWLKGPCYSVLIPPLPVSCGIPSLNTPTLFPSFLPPTPPTTFLFVFQVINVLWTGCFSHSWQLCSSQLLPKVNHGPLSDPWSSSLLPFPAKHLGGSLLLVSLFSLPLSQWATGGLSRTLLQIGLVFPLGECNSAEEPGKSGEALGRETRDIANLVKRKSSLSQSACQEYESSTGLLHKEKVIMLRYFKATQQYYTTAVSFRESRRWIWGDIIDVDDKEVKVIITKLFYF